MTSPVCQQKNYSSWGEMEFPFNLTLIAENKYYMTIYAKICLQSSQSTTDH
jgi:hypothetical protein